MCGQINDKDIRIFPFPGQVITANTFDNNYVSLVDQTIDLYEGRAFITEFAGESRLLRNSVTDPLLLDMIDKYGYVTRFFGRISPEEMTVDPIFDFDGSMPDVSNIHNLTKFDPEVVYGCEFVPPELQVDENVVPAGWR